MAAVVLELLHTDMEDSQQRQVSAMVQQQAIAFPDVGAPQPSPLPPGRLQCTGAGLNQQRRTAGAQAKNGRGPPSPPFLPLVYGNQSWAIGTDSAGPEDLSTHRWKAFVSSPIGPDYDLSKIIRRVQFELHETFKDHKRVVDRFPFDVEESGWGEFEIRLKISFVDPFNKPVELLHPLKLYGNVETHLTSRQKPLVFEFYDEILFPGLLDISPTETTATAAFRAAVLEHQKGVAKCDAWKEWKAREEMDLRYIAATRKQVQQELRIVAREVEKLDQDKADKGGRIAI